jgi:hypothetical protein
VGVGHVDVGVHLGVGVTAGLWCDTILGIGKIAGPLVA